MCHHRQIDKDLPAIRKIPDDLWDEIKLLLPPEKSDKTIGRPVIPFRKVLGIERVVLVIHSDNTWCKNSR
jgi:hypothetical protein